MAKTSINMITLMNEAWAARCQETHSVFEDQTKNLLTHAFVEYENLTKRTLQQQGKSYHNGVFKIFESLMAWLMICDGDFLQGEYDAYCKFCKWAGEYDKSPDELRALCNNTPIEDVIESIQALLAFRPYISGDNYRAMVKGFCYLSLAADKELDKNEYLLLNCFFEPGFDYAPRDWEAFKNEW